MTDKFNIDIASVPDRDEPVAEIWWGDQQIAELRLEGGEERLQIFGPRSTAAWDFNVDSFLAAINTARERL